MSSKHNRPAMYGVQKDAFEDAIHFMDLQKGKVVDDFHHSVMCTFFRNIIDAMGDGTLMVIRPSSEPSALVSKGPVRDILAQCGQAAMPAKKGGWLNVFAAEVQYPHAANYAPRVVALRIVGRKVIHDITGRIPDVERDLEKYLDETDDGYLSDKGLAGDTP